MFLNVSAVELAEDAADFFRTNLSQPIVLNLCAVGDSESFRSRPHFVHCQQSLFDGQVPIGIGQSQQPFSIGRKVDGKVCHA